MAITLLDSASAASDDQLEVYVTLDTTGADLIVFAESYAAGFTAITFYDDLSNTPTDLSLVNNGNFSRFMRLRYMLNPVNTSVAHLFGVQCSTAGFPALQAWAFSGVLAFLDDSTKSQGATGGTIQATAIDVLEAGCLAFSAATCSGNVTGDDLTASLTELAGANNVSLRSGYSIAGVSSFAPTFTLSSSVNAAAASVVFTPTPEPPSGSEALLAASYPAAHSPAFSPLNPLTAIFGH